MKIIVKHVDNLKSQYYPEREITPQFLVYEMTNDNTPISCKICIGEEEKEKYVHQLSLNRELSENKNRDLRNLIGLTLPIEEVSLDEHLKEVRVRENI